MEIDPKALERAIIDRLDRERAPLLEQITKLATEVAESHDREQDLARQLERERKYAKELSAAVDEARSAKAQRVVHIDGIPVTDNRPPFIPLTDNALYAITANDEQIAQIAAGFDRAMKERRK